MLHTYTQTAAIGRDFVCHLVHTQCAVRDDIGNRCPNVSVFHPFCRHHCAKKLCLEVKRSVSHGCGVFALREFKRGDVLVPYTGELTSRDAMFSTQGRDGSPYAVQLANGQWVDASRIRGIGACVNAPIRGSGATANVRMIQASFKLPRDARLFGRIDPTTESHTLVGPNRILRNKGWRRIPTELVKCMHGVTRVWLVANRSILVGEELLLTYGNDDVNQYQHHTFPLLCDSHDPQ